MAVGAEREAIGEAARGRFRLDGDGPYWSFMHHDYQGDLAIPLNALAAQGATLVALNRVQGEGQYQPSGYRIVVARDRRAGEVVPQEKGGGLAL